jgi:ankyrin repeat protein
MGLTMFPKFNKQAFNRLAQSVGEMREFEDSLGIEESFEDSIGAEDEYTPATQQELNNIFLSAAKDDDFETVSDILKSGGVVDITKIGGKALHWASVNGNIEMAKLLIDAGADVNHNYSSALSEALLRKNEEMLKLLLDAGADASIFADGAKYEIYLNMSSKRIQKLVQKYL